ncbi:hypothetical protein [Mycoplasma bradburyae]|uniref:ABC-2 type transport system permease protein n=2 Tax=Mycoplasma bradburyae TaxID=2963128 RepID=A0ABT5G9R5_9MOLU|nr:hypothetical protein [Mycoplasma bradburyae]MDC4181660.1 hypothetical protein [Mycoplasma bradburyae]MDC4183837.1 hypothetical protein [Mycoplasma bradburyae]UTS69918.1 hypothetical protein NMG68_02740 [Mycoplasma bradburyae]
MQNQYKTFYRFLNLFIWSKKSMYIIPIIGFIVILISGLVLSLVNNAELFKTVLIAPILSTLLFNVFYSTNSAITIFKSMESEGVELLLSSKPISRKVNILSKIGYLFIIGFISSIISFVAFNIGLLGSRNTSFLPQFFYNSLIVSSFFVSFFCFITFGFITALISIKLNRRIAYFLMPSLFLPLFLLGNMSGYFSDTAINSFSTNMFNSQKLIPFYNFSTKNTNDEIFIVPKNERKGFIGAEKDAIKLNYLDAKDNSIIFRFMSWLNVPLQFGLAFSENGGDFLNTRSIYKSSLLNDTVYYSQNDNLRYSYELEENKDLSTGVEGGYLVPNLPLTTDNEIIYAWENANAETLLPQDTFGFSTIDNYAGRIKWDVIEEGLKNKNNINFFQEVITKNNDGNFEKLLSDIHANLPELLKKYNDPLNVKFNKLNDLEKQIYLYTLFAYQLFFLENGANNSPLLEDAKKYLGEQIKVTLINGDKYFIGGYSDFRPILRTINNPDADPNNDSTTVIQVARMQLDPVKDKNLFIKVKDFYSVKRIKDAVPAYGLYLFWVALNLILITSVYFTYRRREFK